MLLSSDSDYDSYSCSSPPSSHSSFTSSDADSNTRLDDTFALSRGDSASFEMAEEIDLEGLDEALREAEFNGVDLECDLDQMLAAESTTHTGKRKRDGQLSPEPSPYPKRQQQHHHRQLESAPSNSVASDPMQQQLATQPVVQTQPVASGVPSLQCEVVQGEKDRQASPESAWLRSMKRLTYFNGCLDLHDPDIAQRVALAIVNPNVEGSPELSVSCYLLYADSLQPVELKKEAATTEVLSVISKKGTTKDGATELSENRIDFSSHARRDGVFPTQPYLEVKRNGSALDFSFKFSTNVTSRRHGARNAGRQFKWQMVLSLHLPGLWEPITLTAHSHSFAYISRPAGQEPPKAAAGVAVTGPSKATIVHKEELLLLDVISDARPGDLLLCVGRHLHHNHVAAVIGQGDTVVAELCRLPLGGQASNDSVSTFVTRVPGVPAGEYWVGLQTAQPGFEASTRLPLHVRTH